MEEVEEIEEIKDNNNQQKVQEDKDEHNHQVVLTKELLLALSGLETLSGCETFQWWVLKLLSFFLGKHWLSKSIFSALPPDVLLPLLALVLHEEFPFHKLEWDGEITKAYIIHTKTFFSFPKDRKWSSGGILFSDCFEGEIMGAKKKEGYYIAKDGSLCSTQPALVRKDQVEQILKSVGYNRTKFLDKLGQQFSRGYPFIAFEEHEDRNKLQPGRSKYERCVWELDKTFLEQSDESRLFIFKGNIDSSSYPKHFSLWKCSICQKLWTLDRCMWCGEALNTLKYQSFGICEFGQYEATADVSMQIFSLIVPSFGP